MSDDDDIFDKIELNEEGNWEYTEIYEQELNNPHAVFVNENRELFVYEVSDLVQVYRCIDKMVIPIPRQDIKAGDYTDAEWANMYCCFVGTKNDCIEYAKSADKKPTGWFINHYIKLDDESETQ